jgi:hypothetical protein
MILIYIILAIAVVLFFIGQKNTKEKINIPNEIEKENDSSIEPGMYSMAAILSPTEIAFFNTLVQALPDYYVFPQVSFGALIKAHKTANKTHQGVRNTFEKKRADYVIYTKELNPVAIIELDDKTHNKPRDDNRDLITKQAGYTTLRYNVTSKPSVAELSQAILKLKNN